jgi:hypothetical protein
MFARTRWYTLAASGISRAPGPTGGRNSSSRHVLTLINSRSRTRSEQSSGLLIRGLGVRVPGGARVSRRLTCFDDARDRPGRYRARLAWPRRRGRRDRWRRGRAGPGLVRESVDVPLGLAGAGLPEQILGTHRVRREVHRGQSQYRALGSDTGQPRRADIRAPASGGGNLCQQAQDVVMVDRVGVCSRAQTWW